MAYVDQSSTTEQDKQNVQSPLNQPPTTGSAVGTAGAGDKTPNQPSSSVAPAPFTNLGSYLAVNAPQIQGMAGQVAGQLGQTYQTAKGAVDTGASNIQNQINAGYAAPNADIVNQAATNPTEFAAKPENVAAFQAQYNDKYNGPASAEVTPDYTTTQGAVQKAVNDAANLGNYGGLQSYLTTNLEANPTQAISALDTALLNQSPEAIGQINTAAGQFPGLTDYFSQAIGQQNQNIANAQNAATTNAQSIQNQFTGEGGVIPSFQNDLNARLAAARTLATNQGTAAVNALGDFTKFNPETMKTLGLTPEEVNQLQLNKEILSNYGTTIGSSGQPYYNADTFNLKNYATQASPDVQILPENFATPADYAKAAALAQLTGQDLSGYLNQQNATEAGTYNPNLVQFNKSAAEKYAADTVKDVDKQVIQDVFKFDIDNPDPGRIDPATGKVTANTQADLDRMVNLINVTGDPRYATYMKGIQALERAGVYTPGNAVLKPS